MIIEKNIVSANSVSHDTPALQGCVLLLQYLTVVIDSKEAEIRGNSSTEALHDYRVILRKIRTLVAPLDQAFHPPGLARFKTIFSTIMEKTSYLRDLEGCCAYLDRYSSSNNEGAIPDIEPLLRYIKKQERLERRRVLRYFQSVQYSRFWIDWPDYLQQLLAISNTKADLIVPAGHPIGIFALEVIERSYLKTLCQALKINKQSPPGAFHKLRKSYKKLRYLLEVFGPVLPVKQSREIVRQLKTLQRDLGLFQDAEAQLGIIKEVISAIGDELDKRQLKATDHLLKQIKKQRKLTKIEVLDRIKKNTKQSTENFRLLLDQKSAGSARPDIG